MPCVIVQVDPWVLPTKGDSAAQCFSVTFKEWCKKSECASVCARKTSTRTLEIGETGFATFLDVR